MVEYFNGVNAKKVEYINGVNTKKVEQWDAEKSYTAVGEVLIDWGSQ